MIWLIGNKGMLGTELSYLLKENNLQFIGTDKEIDITNLSELKNFTSPHHIDWIINCAAYTAVDKAENDEDACRLLNAIGAANIALTARTCGAKLIHISTDYVFNGNNNHPYKEEDPTCPIGVYGRTKRDGENYVLKENPSSFIIRSAWLYGCYGNNFVNTMLRLMKEKETISVVMDQRGNPTWAFNLSEVIITILRQINEGKKFPFGIYHYTNEETCTWFEFACSIYEYGKAFGILSKPCKIIPCSSTEYPSKVTRPAYSVLDKTKIKKILNLDIPIWKDSLKIYLKKLGV